MGSLRIYPAKDAMGDPIPLPEWALRLNAEADLAEPPSVEEYQGEAESRGVDHRGFNKP